MILLIVYVVYAIYEAVKGGLTTALPWWLSWLGVKPTSGNLPDTTGSLGAQISAQAQTTTYAASQGAYDVALSAYATAQGFPTSLSAQGTTGWPWVSYDAWITAGMPSLPTQ